MCIWLHFIPVSPLNTILRTIHAHCHHSRLHSLLRSPQLHFHFYHFSKTALVQVTSALHIAKFQSQLILRPHFPQLEEQLTLDIASSFLKHFLLLVLRRPLSAFHPAYLAIPVGLLWWLFPIFPTSKCWAIPTLSLLSFHLYLLPRQPHPGLCFKSLLYVDDS